jgi:hypothetical protein
MKNIYKYCIAGLLITTGLFACRQHYFPPEIAGATNYLVVEGFINTADSTFITLSRTVKLSDAKATQAETKATVTIESSTGASYKLTELKTGTYGIGPLGLSNNLKYRVRIKTSANREYVSDLVTSYITPPIDSLFFRIESDNVHIYSNAHDAPGNTRYYRWNFDETYQYTSTFLSDYESNGKAIVLRDKINNDIYTCWLTTTTPTIIIGSSAKLAQNVINEVPIAAIPGNSIKFSIKYSINVRQYAMSEEAFTFWQNLKKNTEQLGSIFDAQPSQIQGNVHAVSDVNEPVFGYVQAGTIQQKRIFITRDDVFPLRYTRPNICEIDTVLFFNPETKNNDVVSVLYPKLLIPLEPYFTSGPSPAGYTATIPIGTDCTTQGGKNKRPSFWK